ncbi:carboxymuconolactone decarboxylase family protein [Sporosarcina sp. FSL K6-1522]|uniref:carboxymuconolactone decarboxylase family protein n=1 Tax=Sporosarcina sp. FSL K6-1522 TaxID=2921554 RepID=UPI00315AE504
MEKDKGYEILRKLTGNASMDVIENLQSFSPDFGNMIIDFGFGEIYSRPLFDLKQRELITLTSLITQGAGERQLTFHYKAALHVGLTVEEIQEIAIQCAAYAGFPKAAFALEVLKKVVEGE